MSLSYSKKNKCQGCQALLSNPKGYTCALGFQLTFEFRNEEPWQPVPLEKCYKPKSTAELREAKLIIKKKLAKSEA